MKINQTVVDAINEHMTEENISVYSVAKTTGISQPTLQRALKGVIDLTLERYVAICAALDIDGVDILATSIQRAKHPNKKALAMVDGTDRKKRDSGKKPNLAKASRILGTALAKKKKR